MKNKGFTLVELLAVIVILSVVSLIAFAIIQKNIDATRKSSFETSVKNMIEAAKEYVVTNYEENDFPEGGIDITNDEIDIKNSEFISGIIMKNESGSIEVINLTDGNMCANGTKNDLEITPGACEASDKTPPTIEIKVLKKTPNKVRFLVKVQDAQSGLKELRYSYGGKEEVKELPNKRNKVKAIIEVDNLEAGNRYSFKFTVVNNIDTSDETLTTTTKEKEVELPMVDDPKISVSSGTYATTKTITLTYPEVEGYSFSYIIDGEEIQSEDGKATIEISEDKEVKAIVKNENGEEVSSSSLYVTGLDNTAPTAYVYIEGRDEWTKSKKVYVKATDVGAGIALRGYSLNKKKSWIKIGEEDLLTTLKENQQFTLKTRDKVGNIQERFHLCEDREFKDCGSEELEFYEIRYVDNIKPKVKLEVIEGTMGVENWYSSKKVILQATVTDTAYGIINEKKEEVEGSGINEIIITNNNKAVVVTPVEGTIGKNKIVYRIEVEDGINNYSLIAKDKAANEETQTITIKKDSTAPIAKVFIENKDAWTTSKKVYVQATDAHIGLHNTPYSLNSGTSWVKLNSDGTIATLKSNQQFTLRTKDKNGNTATNFLLCTDKTYKNCSEVSSYTVQRIDNIKPKIELTVVSGTAGSNGWYTSSSVVLQVKVTDTAYVIQNGKTVASTGSGIKAVTAKRNNSAYSLGTPYSGALNTNTVIYRIPINDNGTYTFNFTAQDMVPNTATGTITIKKDNVTPKITITKTTFTGNTVNTSSMMTVTAGVSSYSLSCNPSTLPAYKRTSATCTATGGNGLKATVTQSFGYTYTAKANYHEETHKYNCHTECGHSEYVCTDDGWCGNVCSSEYTCHEDGWCGNVGGEHEVCDTYTETVFDGYSCPNGGTANQSTGICTV